MKKWNRPWFHQCCLLYKSLSLSAKINDFSFMPSTLLLMQYIFLMNWRCFFWFDICHPSIMHYGNVWFLQIFIISRFLLMRRLWDSGINFGRKKIRWMSEEKGNAKKSPNLKKKIRKSIGYSRKLRAIAVIPLLRVVQWNQTKTRLITSRDTELETSHYFLQIKYNLS